MNEENKNRCLRRNIEEITNNIKDNMSYCYDELEFLEKVETLQDLENLINFKKETLLFVEKLYNDIDKYKIRLEDFEKYKITYIEDIKDLLKSIDSEKKRINKSILKYTDIYDKSKMRGGIFLK